ncbi:hypothetical protein ZEAMMB73_Zm00001d047429 [Zea mays]|uniref:Uncharacterized protein n=1 Tax=Zea mays TaxID=4577 RepID=A0A1D6P9F0_MAIZE|nr:hypothetical protein ZEAMMB73_Zm00001d047429 [Zea mays]
MEGPPPPPPLPKSRIRRALKSPAPGSQAWMTAPDPLLPKSAPLCCPCPRRPAPDPLLPGVTPTADPNSPAVLRPCTKAPATRATRAPTPSSTRALRAPSSSSSTAGRRA